MRGKRLVIVGSGSGIARRIAFDAHAAGAEVALAGRIAESFTAPGIRTARADFTDET